MSIKRLLVAAAAAPLLLVGTCYGYQLRNLELLVIFGPEYGYPAEPGDTLVMARRILLLPGLFGNEYVDVARPFVSWRLSDRNEAPATINGRTLRLTGGGRVALDYSVVPPLRLRRAHTDEFEVAPEAIESIRLTLPSDTVAAGDTLRLRVQVRGISGASLNVKPMLLWPGSLLHISSTWDSSEVLVTGLAMCEGTDSIGVWVGHHSTVKRLVVLPHTGPVTDAQTARGWNPVTGKNSMCQWRLGWSASVKTPWASPCTGRGGHAPEEPSCRDWRFRPSRPVGN